MSLGGALPAFLTSTASAAGAPVTSTNSDGWQFITTGDASGAYTAAPANNVSSNGSYELKSTSGKKGYLYNTNYSGMKLSDLSNLAYSYYVANRSPGSVAPVISLVTTINGHWTQLNLEPTYTNGAPAGSWQTLNAFTASSKWYSTHTITNSAGTVTVPAFNGVADLTSWSTLVSLDPNAVLGTDDGASGLRISFGQNSGGAPWTNFDGYVDNVDVNGTSYDFEATPPAAPTNLGFTQGTKTLACGAITGASGAYGTHLHWTIPAGETATEWKAVPTYPSGSHGTTYSWTSGTDAWIGANIGQGYGATPNDQGVYSYSVTYKNADGLWSNPATCSFTYDSVAPVVNILEPTSNPDINTPVYASNLGALTVSGTATDVGGSGVAGKTLTVAITDYSVNPHQALVIDYPVVQADGSWSISVPAGTLPDGHHMTISAATRDSATNVGSDHAFFIVDNSVPTVPALLSPVNRGYEKTNDFNFDWTDSTDNTSGVTYEFQSSNSSHTDSNGALDTGVWNNILNGAPDRNNLTTSEIHSYGAPDGTYYWQVRAIDASGNKSAWTTPWKMTIDTHAPSTTLNVENLANGYVNSRQHGDKLTITGSAGDNLGLNRVLVQLLTSKHGAIENHTVYLSGTSDNWSTDFDIKSLGLTDGNYSVVATVVDNAGNTYKTSYLDYTLDNTKPVAQFTSSTADPTPNGFYNNDFNVGYTVSDNYKLANVTVALFDTDSSHTNHYAASCYYDGAETTANDAGTCTVHLPAGLPDGKYYVQIGGQDAAGLWTVNATRTVYIQRTAPAQPANLQVKYQNDGTYISNGSTLWQSAKPNGNNLELTWTDKAGDWVTGHDIKVTYPNGSTDSFHQGPNTNSWLAVYNNFGKEGNGKYVYSVVADNPNGTSTPSDTFTLYYDTQSPTASFTQTPPTYVNGNFWVYGAASDNVALNDAFFDVRDASGWVAGCVPGTSTSNPSPIAGNTSVTLSCEINTSNLTDGQTYTLRVHDSDMTNHYGGGSQVSITVDRVAPTITVKPGYVGDEAQNIFSNVSFKLHDNNAVDYYTLNGHKHELSNGPWSDANYQNFKSQLVQGSNTIVLYDVAGNSTSYMFTYDSTAPVATIDGTNPDGKTFDGSTSIDTHVIDDNYLQTDITRTGDSFHQTYKAPGTWFGLFWLKNGQYKMVVSDAAGNSTTYNFTIQRNNPSITFVNPTRFNGSSYNQYFQNIGDIQIHATGDNRNIANTTVHVYNSDGSYSSAWCGAAVAGDTASCDASGLADGSYYVKVAATDVNGNATYITKSFTIDSTAPLHPTNLEVNGQSGTFYTTVGAPFAQTWKDKSKDVVSYNYVSCYVATMPTSNNCSGTTYKTTTASASKQVNSGDTKHDEVFFWQVQAVDAAGNTSGWSTWSKVVVDSTAPTIENLSLDRTPTNDNSVTVSGTISDTNLASYTYQIVDSSKKNVLGEYSWSKVGGTSSVTNGTLFTADITGLKLDGTHVAPLPDGNYFVRVWATDNSGNKTGIASHIYLPFTVDRTAPKATINAYSGTNTTPTITGTVDDPTATLTVAIDGGTPQAATNNGDGTWFYTVPTALTVGSHTVSVTAKDAANNQYQISADVAISQVLGAAITTGNGAPANPNTRVTITPNNDGHVLGDSTTASSTTDTKSGSNNAGNVKGDSTVNVKDAANTKSGNFLGLGWWWLLIVAAIIAFFWFLVGRRANENDEA